MKITVKDSCFSHLSVWQLPRRAVLFFASASPERVCSTRVMEPTGSLNRRCTDNVVAQRGLSCRQILYFNADLQKYDLVQHMLFWHLNLSSDTRVYLANKMGPSSDSASPLCLYVCGTEQRHVLYGWLHHPDLIIPSLPCRDLIQSTNGVSLQAGIAHNQSNVPLSAFKSASMADLCPVTVVLSQLQKKKPQNKL